MKNHRFLERTGQDLTLVILTLVIQRTRSAGVKPDPHSFSCPQHLRALFFLSYSKKIDEKPDHEWAITSNNAASALRKEKSALRKARSNSEPPLQKQEMLHTLI